MTGSLNPGDFVWTNFPFEAEPNKAGPMRHAGFVLATFSARDAARITPSHPPKRGIVVAVYTSSQVEKFGSNLPIGVISVPANRARKMGDQSAFFIDVRKRAFMPLTRDFFPEIDKPGFGIIGPSDKGLFNEVRRQFILINEKHKDLIVNLGPHRP